MPSFTSYPVPLDTAATPIVVYRYDRTQTAGQRLTSVVANVRCLSVEYSDGPHPPAARFEYVFDDSDLSNTYPDKFEDVWPLGVTSPYAVKNDDELVVMAYAPDGSRKVIFHGFAQIPQIDVSPTGQSANFVAVGVAVRLWDTPISGSIWRQGDKIISQLATDAVQVDLPCHFNPYESLNGASVARPNCTLDGTDINEGTSTGYPVFCDPDLERVTTPQTEWTLSKLARYLLMTNNKDQKYVTNPDMTTLEALLDAYSPKGDAQTYDLTDSSTYTATPVVVRDFDATNMAWPDAIHRAINPHNFSFRFTVDTDSNDEPTNAITFYRKDAKNPIAPKPLLLQSQGSNLDPGRTNVGSLGVARDNASVANRWVVEVRPTLYEVSVILAPGFAITAGDESEANRPKFKRAGLAEAIDTLRAAYRRYILDETADGHWDYPSASIKQTLVDLSPVFGKAPARPDGSAAPPLYVNRCRPGRGTLISVDASGRPYRAELAFSRDYAGVCPAVWDGTAHWQPISGGWELLKDRLGIVFTVEDPEGISLGQFPAGPNKQNASEKLAGITSQSAPTATGDTKRFFLRLTCVIESDAMIQAVAEKRAASPSQFAITRRIEASDHFVKKVIAAWSMKNQTATAITQETTDATTGAVTSAVRDDTTRAKSHAQALRAAHEFPLLAGGVTIPWMSLAYIVGDRISSIQGRDASLAVNVGAGTGESAEYPWVDSVAWSFGENGQSTTLQLSDRRARREGT